MRLLRLGAGLWLFYSAFADRQPLLGILGGIFTLQALLNVGCSACAPMPPKNTRQKLEDTTYEEVK